MCGDTALAPTRKGLAHRKHGVRPHTGANERGARAARLRRTAAEVACACVCVGVWHHGRVLAGGHTQLQRPPACGNVRCSAMRVAHDVAATDTHAPARCANTHGGAHITAQCINTRQTGNTHRRWAGLLRRGRKGAVAGRSSCRRQFVWRAAPTSCWLAGASGDASHGDSGGQASPPPLPAGRIGGAAAHGACCTPQLPTAEPEPRAASVAPRTITPAHSYLACAGSGTTRPVAVRPVAHTAVARRHTTCLRSLLTLMTPPLNRRR